MTPTDRDTIVAVATPPGEGGIGIVRLSGPDAIAIGARFFEGKRVLSEVESHRLVHGRFMAEGQVVDEVLVSVMRAPASYTAEDTVEFNCHGGPFLLRRAAQALVEGGARPALPGEFTKRAFLNGKLDLAQAEAVADLISAQSDFGLQSAYFQLRGGLCQKFEAISHSLHEALVYLEGGLDFSEDVDVPIESVCEPVRKAAEQVDALLSSYTQGRLLRDGALVALTGRPNVGKSSLLNRFLSEDRAIVSDIPGTTRDTIEEPVNLAGLLAKLVDTAGLRANTDDQIELEGTRRTQQYIQRADLVLLLVDGSHKPAAEDLDLVETAPESRTLLVLNKSDLSIQPLWERLELGLPHYVVSARTGDGVDELRTAIRTSLLGERFDQPEVVTHERHYLALQAAGACLGRFLEAAETGLPGEVLALDLRSAADALADILGKTTPEAVLATIFKTFCIGK